MPDEGDVGDPIAAVALRAVGADHQGAASCARVDAVGRSAKRVVCGTPERETSARSSSLTSATRGLSPALVGALKDASVDVVGEVEGVASSFGIAGLPLEESLGVGTPSHVYDGGSKDTIVVGPAAGTGETGGFFFCIIFFVC